MNFSTSCLDLESLERQCRICPLCALHFWHSSVILVILREDLFWAHWIWRRYWLEWEKGDARKSKELFYFSPWKVYRFYLGASQRIFVSSLETYLSSKLFIGRGFCRMIFTINAIIKERIFTNGNAEILPLLLRLESKMNRNYRD